MTTQSFSAGEPCWIDLLTSDADRSRAFYSELFGWTAGESSGEFGGYFMFFKDGVPVAGGMPKPDGLEAPDGWNVYLSVADAHKTLEVAQSHGGQVALDAGDVADLGTFGSVIDPGGAAIGLWQAKSFAGFGTPRGAGSPRWFELHSTAYDAAVQFYREVFGWDAHTMSDQPGFRYTTLGADTNARAGILDAAGVDDATPGWSIYFGTDDADASLARVTELGGRIERPAEDTPYGRLATVLDPLGVRIKLMAPNEAMPMS